MAALQQSVWWNLCLGHCRWPCQDADAVNILIIRLDDSLQSDLFTFVTSGRALWHSCWIYGWTTSHLQTKQQTDSSALNKYQLQYPKYCLPTSINTRERNIHTHQGTATSTWRAPAAPHVLDGRRQRRVSLTSNWKRDGFFPMWRQSNINP